MVWLLDLPDEVVIRILSHLPVHDLLDCASTCHRLYDLAYSPERWRGFCLTLQLHPRTVKDRGGDAYRDSLIQAIQTLSTRIKGSITSLVWIVPPGFLPALCAILENNTFSMKMLHINDDSLKPTEFCSLLPQLERIEKLSLVACSGVEDSVLEILSTFPQLKELDLSYCSKISDEAFRSFSESCCRRLESVNTDNVNMLTDWSITSLLLRHHESLRHLNIDGENNTDSIFDFIPECTNLETLIVNFGEQLTDRALQLSSRLRNLKHVCFRKANNFTSTGVGNFLYSCDLGRLSSLNLTECASFDDSCAVLIPGQCPNLTHLSLGWCWETTELGVSAIMEGCGLLEEVDLTGLHQITGQCFQSVPVHSPRLRLLRLEMCNNVQDDILLRLVRAMPGQLHVYNYYSELLYFDPRPHGDSL